MTAAEVLALIREREGPRPAWTSVRLGDVRIPDTSAEWDSAHQKKAIRDWLQAVEAASSLGRGGRPCEPGWLWSFIYKPWLRSIAGHDAAEPWRHGPGPWESPEDSDVYNALVEYWNSRWRESA
jgi:hypothetical protein